MQIKIFKLTCMFILSTYQVNTDNKSNELRKELDDPVDQIELINKMDIFDQYPSFIKNFIKLGAWEVLEGYFKSNFEKFDKKSADLYSNFSNEIISITLISYFNQILKISDSYKPDSKVDENYFKMIFENFKKPDIDFRNMPVIDLSNVTFNRSPLPYLKFFQSFTILDLTDSKVKILEKINRKVTIIVSKNHDQDSQLEYFKNYGFDFTFKEKSSNEIKTSYNVKFEQKRIPTSDIKSNIKSSLDQAFKDRNIKNKQNIDKMKSVALESLANYCYERNLLDYSESDIGVFLNNFSKAFMKFEYSLIPFNFYTINLLRVDFNDSFDFISQENQVKNNSPIIIKVNRSKNTSTLSLSNNFKSNDIILVNIPDVDQSIEKDINLFSFWIISQPKNYTKFLNHPRNPRELMSYYISNIIHRFLIPNKKDSVDFLVKYEYYITELVLVTLFNEFGGSYLTESECDERFEVMLDYIEKLIDLKKYYFISMPKINLRHFKFFNIPIELLSFFKFLAILDIKDTNLLELNMKVQELPYLVELIIGKEQYSEDLRNGFNKPVDIIIG